MLMLMEDTRQQANKHKAKHDYFDSHGIKYERCRLYVGDYTLPTNQSVCVDTKFSMGEVYNCMTKDHERFKREADRAKEAGIKLYILVEEPKIKTLRDVATWQNPRYLRWLKVQKAREQGRAWAMKAKWNPKPPMKSVSLMKAMYTFAEKHGVEWVFCPTAEAGAKIVELLTQERTDEK